MPSILFVCTANRFRSPLAAAILRKTLSQMGMSASWEIASAGTWAETGQPVLSYVAEAARGFGIDLSAHRSRRVNEALLTQYDLILVMQASQREALLSEFPSLEDHIYLLSHVAERGSYDIPDVPGSAHELRAVITELQSLIRRGTQSICVMATYLYNTRQREMESKAYRL
jgi:protein-tyrosine-phosphatase